jgi:phosphatidate cytidylyltransferase
MSNILIRTLSGALFIIIVIGSFLLGVIPTAIVVGFFMTIALNEFYKMFTNEGKSNPLSILGLFIGLITYLVVLSNLLNWVEFNLYLVYIPLFLLVFIPVLVRKEGNPILDISITIMGWLYVVLPFSIFLLIYKLPSVDSDWLIISGMFLIIWSNDTFAYLSGRFFGKHKLFERISPKKTWEGTAGGFIFAIIAGVVYAYFTDESFLFWGIGACIVSVGGVIGDLIESKIKRITGVKDSGNIMPGHGGILDRFDAIMFAAPFFYIWCILFFEYFD